MKWDDWDPELWKRVKEETDSQIREFDHEIWASDRSPKAVAIAEGNINYAHLQHDIHLMKKDMNDLTPPEGGGILIINPPYGDRLEEDDIDTDGLRCSQRRKQCDAYHHDRYCFR